MINGKPLSCECSTLFECCGLESNLRSENGAKFEQMARFWKPVFKFGFKLRSNLSFNTRFQVTVTQRHQQRSQFAAFNTKCRAATVSRRSGLGKRVRSTCCVAALNKMAVGFLPQQQTQQEVHARCSELFWMLSRHCCRA